MPTTIQGTVFYTIPEAAKELKVSPLTIRNYISKGKLKSQRIGRPIYITESDLREFIGEATAQANDPTKGRRYVETILVNLLVKIDMEQPANFNEIVNYILVDLQEATNRSKEAIIGSFKKWIEQKSDPSK